MFLNKSKLLIILTLILNSCAATNIGLYSKMELKSQNQVNYKFAIGSFNKDNYKDRIFVENNNYLYHIYLYNYTQSGIGLYGVTPFLAIPLVYLPWFYIRRNCEIDKYGVVFYLTIVNKTRLDDENNNFLLNEKDVYLLNKEKQERIYPVFFEKIKRNHGGSIIDNDTNNILYFNEELKKSNFFRIQFKEPKECKNLSNYSLIIEKDGAILLKINIVYNSLSFEYFFMYGF
jgi:hypothetical protein